ncbi:MAG: UPF0716 protein FxsA [Bacteriovoracaceae bacterium]|jgi:UPF0716 protein FxsA
MFGLLVILFTVVPAVEIFLLFKIGGQIGGLNTVFVVISTGIIGASLAKSQGLSILMKIQGEMNKGSLPGNEIIQGLMIFAGGLLLLTPGFMTDFFGLSLVMPGTRHFLMFWVKKLITQAMKNGNLNFQTFGAGAQGGGFSYSSTSAGGFPGEQSPFEQFETRESSLNEQIDGDVIEAEYTEKK